MSTGTTPSIDNSAHLNRSRYSRNALGQAFAILAALSREVEEVLHQGRAQLGREVGRETLRVPLCLNSALHLLDWQEGQSAVRSTGVSASAVEVQVQATAPALVDSVEQPRVAATAVQPAAQVVLVPVRAVA